MGGIFGAEYFGQYRFQGVILVVTPTPAGRTFRGASPLGRPLLRIPGIAVIVGAEAVAEVGEIRSAARAKGFLPGIAAQFQFGNPGGKARARIAIQGVEMRTESGHDEKPSTVTLGRSRTERSDDDEALAFLNLYDL